MKKILTILLCGVLLVGCSQGTSGDISNNASQQGGEVSYTIGGVPLKDFAVVYTSGVGISEKDST